MYVLVKNFKKMGMKLTFCHNWGIYTPELCSCPPVHLLVFSSYDAIYILQHHKSTTDFHIKLFFLISNDENYKHIPNKENIKVHRKYTKSVKKTFLHQAFS